MFHKQRLHSLRCLGKESCPCVTFYLQIRVELGQGSFGEGARRRPPPGEDGRPETARERLMAKVSRKAKATARFRDAQDDWNERERFPNRWEER